VTRWFFCELIDWAVWYVSHNTLFAKCAFWQLQYLIDNEIYLYKMLTTNLLQVMLVRRAEQSYQHWQSSNSALLMHWAYTQSKSEAITTQSLMRWSLHIHRVTATSLHTCCNIYTYTAKTQFSFCTYTDKRDAVNQLIFRIFRLIYMQRNYIQSSNSALFTCWVHIWYTYIYCKGTTQLLRIYRQTWCSKSIDFSHFQTDLHAAQSHTEQ